MIRLLGPLEVAVDGRPVRVTGRPSVLLLALAASAGRVVSLDRLATATWGEDPPDNPRGSLQTLVRRLRGVIDANRIETHAAGYLLRAETHEIDVLQFIDLLDQAKSTSDTAAERHLIDEALTLWRGVPFEGVRPAWLAQSQAPWLVERYLTAIERRLDLDLAARRHDGLAAQLRDLIARHPLRESLWVRLLTVLDLTGRRAEALEQYETIRRKLAEELGVDPGAELRALHGRLLAADNATGAAPADGIVPRQLPPDVAGFVGRDDLLAAMDERLGSAASPLLITAIGGAAGIGKTSLAVHWAHRIADRFPDGQLYANLRGFDPTGSPRQPGEIVRGFLDALAVPAHRVPAGFEAQIGLYRSLLARRRMLVLLDNARDAEQVRPLLPGSPGSQVVVTSRDRLTSLIAMEGARPVQLDVLSENEAWQLFSNRIGARRVNADPEATADIIDRCARLPLALAIVAARAALRPDVPLRTIARELAGLDAFADADPVSDMRAVFSWSYRTLHDGAARLFRLLGLHPGTDIGIHAVASLAGVPLDEARALLSELVSTHLLTEHDSGRYSFHDLLRAYAAEQAQTVDTPADRDAAAHRLLDHYLHTAYLAENLIRPHRDPLTLAEPRPGVIVVEAADVDTALAWFATELRTMLKAIQWAGDNGFDSHVWELSWTLTAYIDTRGQWHDALDSLVAAQAAVGRLGDPTRQSGILRQLARVYNGLSRYDDAESHLRQALEISRLAGDRVSQARTHRELARVYADQGGHAQALEQMRQSLKLSRAAGHRRLEAMALNGVGWFLAHLGELGPAAQHCLAALRIQQETGDLTAEASTADSIGYIRFREGAYDDALRFFERSVELFQAVGDEYQIAEVLLHLADTHQALGNADGTRAAWQRAYTIFAALDRPEADRLRVKLASPSPASPSPASPSRASPSRALYGAGQA